MRWLWILFISSSAFAACTGSVPNLTATPDVASINSCISTASNGTTITVTAGSFTAGATAIAISGKNITLVGTGTPPTQGSSGNVTITASASCAIDVTPTTTGEVRVSNFSFSGAQMAVCTHGSTSSSAFRVDHLTFNASGSNTYIQTDGNAPGVIDHNSFTAGGGAEMIHNIALGPGSTAGWTDTIVPGGPTMLFIEDNTFTCTDATVVASAVQSYYGARTVMRHNTFVFSYPDQHGTPGNVGARWWEIYNNTFNIPSGKNQCCAAQLRGGSGVYFNNTTTGSGSMNSGAIDIFYEQSGDAWPAAWQPGSGWNGNTNGHNSCSSPTRNSAPAYFWGNTGQLSVSNFGSSSCTGGGGGACVQANRDYFDSGTGSQPSSMKWILNSTDTCSTTYVYTPYTYPHPLVSGLSQAATPSFSPSGGTFGPNQNPTITSSSSGAIICWAVSPTVPATNGDGATCSSGTSLTNGGSVAVNSSETLEAVAGTATLADSAVSLATFTITGVATPAFSPAAGNYVGTQTVTLSSASGAGVIICYTTDGTTPTAPTPGTCGNGTAISNNGSILVSTSLTVKALGTEAGWNNSAVATALYTITSPPPTKVANISGGMIFAGGMKIIGMGSAGGGGSLCGPPAYLCSLALNPSVSLSTQPVQLPNPIPPMGPNSNITGNFLGANSIVTDNICNGVSGCSNPRILRVSDGGTSVSVPDPTTCAAPANFSAAADFSGNDTDLTWNSNDTYFGIAWNSQDKFCIVPFSPSAFQMLSPSAEGLSGQYYLVPSKKISWSHSNPLVLYDIEQSSTACPVGTNPSGASLCVMKYDFTGGFSSPTITKIYDFLATGNCLAGMAAGGPTTGGVLTVSYDDTVFSTDESDTGAQDSAQFEVVYKIGTGCTVFNTWNTADAGIPAGTIVLPNGSQITPTYQNASNTSQFLKIHESFGHGNGTTLLVSASTCTGTNPCTSDGPYLWVIGTSQIIATQSSGHFAMGYDLYIHGASPQGQIASITTTNPPVNTFLISSSSPNNLTGFVTPPGFELHISWNNAANTNTNFIFPEWDTVNIFNGVNGVNGTPTNPFTSVGQNEIDGYPASSPGSAGALIHRMGHLYISSFINNNTQFTGAYGIMTTSQTGKYATFTSDWICGLGASNGTNTPVCPGAGWQASTTYPAGFVLTPGIGVSKSGNSAWNTYKSAGSCTTSSSQQFTITSIAETGTTATVTVSGTLSSLFQVGSVININGTSTAGYNTPNYTLTGVTSNTVTFTAASGLGSSTGGSANFQWQQANTTDGSCTWNYQAGSAPRNDVFVIELK